jgi:hypothetical protein
LDSVMGPLQLIISGVGSLLVYGMMIAGVYKLFQIATDLTEIKDTLQEIKRNTLDAAPRAWTPAKESSPESLMRALDSASADPAEIESQS